MNDLWNYIKKNLSDEDFVKICCGAYHLKVQADGISYSPTAEGLIKGPTGRVTNIKIRNVQKVIVIEGNEDVAKKEEKPKAPALNSVAPPATPPTPSDLEASSTAEEKAESTIPPKVESTIPPKVESTIPPKVESTIPPKAESTIPPKVESTIPPKVESAKPVDSQQSSGAGGSLSTSED